MRIFNGRYFLVAAALLTVWLLGRSRSSQLDSDASWTNVTVGNLTDAGEVQESGLAAVCDQASCCSDDAIASAAGCCSNPQTNPQTNDECRLDICGEGFTPIDDAAETENLAMVESQSAAFDNAEFTAATDFEPSGEPEVFESADSINELAAAEPIKESSDTFLPITIDGDSKAKDQKRVGNMFVAEAGASIDAATEAEESDRAWRKNPFADDLMDVPSVDGGDVERTMPASFESNSSSILDAGDNLPKPDLSQIEYVDPEIAPVSRLSESMAQEAVHHIEYGKSLARRGAAYGARQEFFSALGVIARGNDTQMGGNAHTTSLKRAIRALREVQDFAIRDVDSQIGVRVADIIETHQTRIVSENEAAVITPVEAMQRYMTFAHQQLDFAGGRNIVVAEALFCLGKLHTVMAKHHPEKLDIAKAIVFHRAALAGDSTNHRSLNELGVLLARSGQLGEAENLFKNSLRVQPSAETWQNLAKTHDRRGEAGLAQLAQTESAIAAQAELIDSTSAQITWLPQQAFSQVGPADFHDSSPASSTVGQDVVPASRTAALADKTEDEKTEKKSFSERFNLKKWF